MYVAIGLCGRHCWPMMGMLLTSIMLWN